MLRAEEQRGLVDAASEQTAFEGAFAGESWWIARGGEAAVFNRFVGLLNAVEDAACNEMQQPAAARELQFEGALPLVAGLAVGFEVAATSGKVNLLDGSRGRGKEFWGGVCHKHVSVLQLVYFVYAAVCACIQDFLHLP